MIAGGGSSLWTEGSPESHHLVLLGGGHTHVQVLKHLIMNAKDPVWSRPGLVVTLIVDQPIAIYSGMVPGFVAGQYQRPELEIDTVPLAQLAGARVVLARALGVDSSRQEIDVAGRAPIRYDLLSIDIGSSVLGLDLPGVAEHALASRPISNLAARVESTLALAQTACRERGQTEIVVVGAGAGGIELAFTIRERLRKGIAEITVEPQVTVVHAAEEILPGSPASLIKRVRRAAAARSIDIRTGARVQEIHGTEGGRKQITLEGGGSLSADAVLWVTGSAPHTGFDPGTLAVDPRGFLTTLPTLLVKGTDNVFAVGDCATLHSNPTPKAGVYAVRQGPVLIQNIERWASGRSLRTYTPQSDFLTLLNLGDGTAIGSKKSIAFEGRWVMRLKNRIDRKFMSKFQVLDPTGQLTPAFAAIVEEMSSGNEQPMPCGGCAAKLEQSALERALSRLNATPGGASRHATTILGLEQPDDVAAWQTPGGDTVVRSVDAFRAFADDPWLVGRVAAENALSDLYAKGVEPRYALALVGLPLDLSPTDAEELLFQVLSGARATLNTGNVELLGGHTTLAQELWVGFSVDGVEEKGSEALIRTASLNDDDQLILTKPLGTGVLLHAHMMGQLSGPDYGSLCDSLTRSNRRAGQLARLHGASAATDITGFGLIGHLLEMLPGDGTLQATLDPHAINALAGARECLDRGLRSTAHRANSARRSLLAPFPGNDAQLDLLFDPQTSGGLLIAISTDKVQSLLAALIESGCDQAAMIGSVRPASTKADPATATPRITWRGPSQ